MDEFLLEMPWTLGICGALSVLLTAVVWTQTGARAVAWSALGLAALTTILVIISLQIKTDREQIRQTIDEVAAALQANNFDKALSYMHPSAVEGLRHASGELKALKFNEARVTRIKSISVQRRNATPTALAEFNVAVGLEAQGQRANVRRFVKVYFLLHNNRWLVKDYEHSEPTAGFREDRP